MDDRRVAVERKIDDLEQSGIKRDIRRWLAAKVKNEDQDNKLQRG